MEMDMAQTAVLGTDYWLPMIFAGLMGFSILLYVILDGYDLGVGMLMAGVPDDDKDMMLASIGPFWDANETWLVMAVGLLLVAFPVAHGTILTALYLPTLIMLVALILRGVSFDFRAKVKAERKPLWNRLFFLGSLGMSASQGYMLGLYIMGFEAGWGTQAFALACAVGVTVAYAFIGACWLIMKGEGHLQRRAVSQARKLVWLLGGAIALISLATPLVSDRIFEKWFAFPYILVLLPLPIMTALILVGTGLFLNDWNEGKEKWCWLPFTGAVTLFLLCFNGLAYSFYPYIVPEKMTIVEAAASSDSLMIILVGALFVLPCILGYTVYSYKVFWGKVQKLSYY